MKQILFFLFFCSTFNISFFYLRRIESTVVSTADTEDILIEIHVRELKFIILHQKKLKFGQIRLCLRFA